MEQSWELKRSYFIRKKEANFELFFFSAQTGALLEWSSLN